MMRSIHAAMFNPMYAADTGEPAGGGTAAAPPTGDTVTGTPDNATPAAGATPPRAKRGKAAAGMSVFPVETLEAGKAMAKEKGGRFTPFTVKSPPGIGKPDRYFVSNHRNAVQHHVATADGYHFASGTGERPGRPMDPAAKAAKADELLAGMDDSARAALFAKYIGSNPALAAALPPAPRRDDTSADFAATLTGQNASNGNANVGNVPPVGNQPVASAASPTATGGKPAAAARQTATAGGGKRK